MAALGLVENSGPSSLGRENLGKCCPAVCHLSFSATTSAARQRSGSQEGKTQGMRLAGAATVLKTEVDL